MFGVRTRKILLAVVMVVLTVILCSCGPIVMAELPSEKSLKADVTDYLNEIAGNDVLLYLLTVDQRVYNEQDGTLDYNCTATYAWDEFGSENENQIAARYVLTDGSWALATLQSNIEQASLDSRLVMHELFAEMPEVPDIVRAAFAGEDTVLTDVFSDFIVELQGKAYQFPCSYAEFALNGWEIAEDSDVTVLRTIPAQSYISLDMVNGDAAITLYVANQTNSAVNVGQGACAGVIVNPQSASAVLANGITEMSSADDIILAYGVPYAEETTPEGRKLTYQTAANSRVNFLLGNDGTTIDVFTLSAQAEQLPVAALFDTYAFGFAVDGVTYTLPVRLDAMLENGWEISDAVQVNDVLSWYETKELTLQKDGQSVDVTLRNPSMGDLRLYAASVKEITLDLSRADFTLVSSDSAERTELTLDQPADAVIVALGQPSRTETTDTAQVLTYASDNGRRLFVTLGEGVAVAQLQSYEADDTAADALQSFALKVSLGSNTYTLPANASEFQDKMWVPDCGWLQPVQAGSFLQTVMENRRTEEIVVYFVNTGQEIVNAQQCTVGGLYAGPDAVNMIVGRSLEKGVAISQVFDLFGIPAYDILDGGTRYLVYGTSISRFLCVRSTDELVDALWIICFTN